MPTQAEITEAGRSLSLGAEPALTLRAIAVDPSWPLAVRLAAKDAYLAMLARGDVP